MTDLALAILVAAGRGERMGAGRPKAFLALAGEPLLLRSARAFESAASVGSIVAVVPAEQIELARALLAPLRKLKAVVAGGVRRQDSVLAGLRQAPEGFSGVVLVHDAARPLVEAALVDAVAAAAAAAGAALPVLPLVDTIKRVSGGRVLGTLDRSELGAAQTPQGFRVDVLARAYEQAFRDRLTVTDEAMAVERLGEPVVAVAGSPFNQKLTTPEDLAWAEGVLGAAGPAMTVLRVGTGFDAHRLVEGRPLVLGGVEIPHDRGLEGHSDGDCVIHAVCDALLGAAAAGDMGRHFPSSDARWKGIASRELLREVARILREREYRVANVDVTVIAQSPVLAPYLEDMRARLAESLELEPEAVSVKAKSTDQLGAIGRSEGIAAQATALLRRNP